MNKYRGETELKLGDRTFTLVPTFSALAEIESETDMGLIDLVMTATQGRMRLTHLMACLKLLAKDCPKPEALGEVLLEHGTTKASVSVGEVILRAMSGGTEGNSDAAEAGNG